MFVPSLSWQMLVVFEYNEKYKTASKKEDPKKTYFHYIIYNIINIYIYIYIYIYYIYTYFAPRRRAPLHPRASARAQAAESRRLQKTFPFVSTFPYACPEPVLVTRS
jgi:hypothetical protein